MAATCRSTHLPSNTHLEAGVLPDAEGIRGVFADVLPQAAGRKQRGSRAEAAGATASVRARSCNGMRMRCAATLCWLHTCSQKTCSGHCSAAVLVMRLSAKLRCDDSSTTSDTRLNAPSPSSSRSTNTSASPAHMDGGGGGGRSAGWQDVSCSSSSMLHRPAANDRHTMQRRCMHVRTPFVMPAAAAPASSGLPPLRPSSCTSSRWPDAVT